LGGFDGSGYWCWGHVIVQPHPTKSSTFDGSVDGNNMAVVRLHSLFQSLTDQFDPTHSHHLIKYLGLCVTTLTRRGANTAQQIPNSQKILCFSENRTELSTFGRNVSHG